MEKIKIEKREELGSILLKLENSKDTDIIFSIPEGSIMLQSIINLKILKKRAEELGKRVTIERRNDYKPALAAVPISKEVPKPAEKSSANSANSAANIAVNAPADFRKTEKQMQVSSSAGRVKMFDIVKKYDASAAASEIKPAPQAAKNVPKEEKAFSREENLAPQAEKEAPVQRRYDPLQRYAPHDSERNVAKSAIPQKNQERQFKAQKKRVLLPSIISRFFYIFIFIVFSMAIVAGAMTLPRVSVDAKLKSTQRDFKLELKVDDKASNIDADKGIIPAQKEEANNEVTETHATTGKKHIVSKATGKITIYNEYSSSDQKIVATTRFLSKEGKLFRAVDDVTIPGFTRVEGQDVPGQVVVDIVADKAGEDFNVGPTSFTIPGFQGSLKYSTIYARSTVAMAGGADREAMYFSESDYIATKDKLVKAVEEKNGQDLSGKQTDTHIPLDGTQKKAEPKIVTDVKIGDVADNFKMTVSINQSQLFYNKENINEIVDAKIAAEAAASGSAPMKAIGTRDPQVQKAVQNEDGSITLPVTTTQDVVAVINVDDIKRDLYNKNENEVKAYFSGKNDVYKSVNVTFSWTQNVPQSNDKINVNIEE